MKDVANPFFLHIFDIIFIGIKNCCTFAKKKKNQRGGNEMATITLEYDGRNSAIKKLIAEILNLGAKEKVEESPYDPEFVKKIKRGQEDIKNGKGIKINIEDLWK